MKATSLLLVLLFATTLLMAAPDSLVGPASGTLLVVGGGDKKDIWPIFLQLAGGTDTRLVVITTANAKTGEDNPDVTQLRSLGVTHLTILHTGSRDEAASDAFVAPLKTAQAVWITGGRQWRLVDSYLHTKTQQELDAVLARGGVIGGSSAGASIQASYLVRGARSGNSILMAPGYEEGFGWLRNVAVDQHVNTRGRENDLDPVLQAHPQLLGIALDESTAIVVRRDRAEVAGAGTVRFELRSGQKTLATALTKGLAFDLASRKTATGTADPESR